LADILSSSIAFVGLVVNIAFLVVLVKQLGVMRKQIDDASNVFVSEQRRIRRQSTLEVIAQTQQYRYDLSKVLPAERDIASVTAFVDEAFADPEKHRLLRNYLNYYENLAAGINSGVYDLKMVARTFGTVLLNIAQAYEPYISRRRDETGHVLAYLEIQDLAAALTPLFAEMGRAAERRPAMTTPADGDDTRQA